LFSHLHCRRHLLIRLSSAAGTASDIRPIGRMLLCRKDIQGHNSNNNLHRQVLSISDLLAQNWKNITDVTIVSTGFYNIIETYQQINMSFSIII
jgi:hypothetical protein